MWEEINDSLEEHFAEEEAKALDTEPQKAPDLIEDGASAPQPNH